MLLLNVLDCRMRQFSLSPIGQWLSDCIFFYAICLLQTRTGIGHLRTPPGVELIPCRWKPLRRTRTLRDPAQTQVWREQVWLDTTFISQGSRSWGKPAVETWRIKTELIIITILHIIFHSFAGFWYPANKICISLVYIIGTNIETKEKKCRTSIHRTESRHNHEEHVHLWLNILKD